MKKRNFRPGSFPSDAKKLGGKGDFGAPEADPIERKYASENTKHSDPGSAHARAGTNSRESGVGADASGPGSSSGGDLDTDIVGVGTGGIAESGPDEPYRGGPDEAEQRRQTAKRHPAPPQHLNRPGGHESTIAQGRDVSTGADSQGGDAATNPGARNDDSFSGEISTDEASGRNSK